jgi:hypothetical protein
MCRFGTGNDGPSHCTSIGTATRTHVPTMVAPNNADRRIDDHMQGEVAAIVDSGQFEIEDAISLARSPLLVYRA